MSMFCIKPAAQSLTPVFYCLFCFCVVAKLEVFRLFRKNNTQQIVNQ